MSMSRCSRFFEFMLATPFFFPGRIKGLFLPEEERLHILQCDDCAWVLGNCLQFKDRITYILHVTHRYTLPYLLPITRKNSFKFRDFI